MIRTIDDLLSEIEFFDGLDEEILSLIGGCAQNASFKEGAYLAREGEPSETFFVVTRGRVGVQIYAPNKGQILLETVDPGMLLGWSWLFPPHIWAFDLQALKPTTVIVFHAQCLREKCEKDPVFGYDLMKRFARLMGHRLEATRMQLLDMYGRVDDE
jgi:CRP/FNR family transcriptional regulator, cyclic AMP receptor protein